MTNPITDQVADPLPPHKQITKVGDVDYYYNLIQNTDEWYARRKGLLTASTMNLVLSPTLKPANNETSRAHIFEIAAQRLTDLPVDNFQSYDMMRGNLEEGEARNLYSSEYEPVKECGFVINNSLGFPVGFSPDGIVGPEGGVEVKSRLAKYQVQTIYQHMVGAKTADHPIPKEFMLQVQASLFVSERNWWDFLSYSNGFNMVAIRCLPIPEYQDAIRAACIRTENQVIDVVDRIQELIANKKSRVTPVEWIDHNEEIQA